MMEQVEAKPTIHLPNFYRIYGNSSFRNGFEFCQPFETPEANGKDKLVPKIIFSKKLVNSCI